MTDRPDETVEYRGPASAGLPQAIGPYTIKREIARGGMGVVFEATQEDPRRTVAVKVMQTSFGGEEMLRRFKYEAQLLARLRHPGIAQVYEAGTYHDGPSELPFFAMEYIPNAKPITEFARDKSLNVRQRLELFAKVCDAVHHGHQRGIVHRDLKPGNILIDSSGQPRVIDFGVARAVDSDMATMQTQAGQIIGSIQYMSPEQFAADSRDIDTRSDVYALGVVLYELLQGKPPYDLSSSTIVEAARVVQEERPAILGGRGSEVTGEVGAIVAKALEKDREYRYQSAHGLATDVRRYLSGEAIIARPPSLTYQLKVFSRRHKGVIAAAAALAVVLVGAAVVSTGAWMQATRERARAEEETAKAVAATEFLKDMMSSAVPDGYGQELTLHTVLDQAVKGLPGAFPDDPQTEADLYLNLAAAYVNLKDFQSAELCGRMALNLAEENLGKGHETTVTAARGLQRIYEFLGRQRDVVEVCTLRLEGEHELYGPDHFNVEETKLELSLALAENEEYGRARQLVDEVLAARREKLEADHVDVLWGESVLALIQLWQGRYPESEALSRRLLERASLFGEDQADMERILRSQLGAALVSQDRIEEASRLYQDLEAPPDFGVLEAFQGTPPPSTDGVNIYVFWESWCPWSQRAVPWLETIHRRYQGQDLKVTGFTTVNRSATDEKVRAFLRSNDITYPIYKESGIARTYLNMPGTPYITVFQDGQMVWEDRLLTERFPEHILAVVLQSGVR